MFKTIKTFLFKNSSTRQTVGKNAFWLTVSNFGGRLIRAIILIYGARVLGTEGFGVFSFALSIAAFLTIFTDLGLSPILTKETAKSADPEHRSKVLSTAFFIKIVFTLAGFVIVFVVASRLTSTGIAEARALLPLMAFLLAFDTLREFTFSFTRALERMELEAGIFLFTNASIVIAGFIALKIAPTPHSFAYAYTAGSALGAAASFYVLRGYFRHLLSRFQASLVRPILTSAWPFAVSGLLSALMINTSNILVGFFRSASEVGLYAAAQRPVQFFYLIPGILASSMFPTFARIAFHDRERLRSLLERSVGLMFLIAIPMAAGGVLLGKDMMHFLYGSEYFSGASSFQILMLTMLVNFPAALLANAVFAVDKQKKLVMFALIGGVSNVVLNMLLIPLYGATGSAWATFIGQFLANAYLWRVIWRVQRFSIIKHLKKIAAATLIMSLAIIALLVLDVGLIPLIGLAVIVYFFALVYLKEPLLTEIKLILRSGA